MRRFGIAAFIIVVVSACALAGVPAKKIAGARSGAVGKTKPAAVGRQTKAGGAGSLVLLYTSSARGQIRSCNCTKFRFGGYGRQLTLLNSIRLTNKDVVLLEGGDITGGSGFQAPLKAGVAAQSLNILGYGAMVPGDEELGLTGEQMVKRFENQTVPLICANLHDKDQSKPKYKPYVILKTVGGLNVGVIGLLDPTLGGEFLERTAGQSISDPVQAAKKQLAAIRKQCDVIVVIYHGPPAATDKLARLSGADLILCTHRHDKENFFPDKDSNIVSVPVNKHGDAYVVDAGTNKNWSLGRLDLALGSDDKIKSVAHKLIYLDRRYTEDPKMVKVYEVYNQKVATAVLTESSKLRKQAEVILVKRGVNVDEARKRLRQSPFATAAACADCHEDASKKWASTRHANAIESLKSVKQEYDPECVGCHVTGMLTRNGYANYKQTPELANVQCEACHGPALDHTKSPEANMGKPDEQTCRSCHTEERNPDFDYEAYWAKIKH